MLPCFISSFSFPQSELIRIKPNGPTCAKNQHMNCISLTKYYLISFVFIYPIYCEIVTWAQRSSKYSKLETFHGFNLTLMTYCKIELILCRWVVFSRKIYSLVFLPENEIQICPERNLLIWMKNHTNYCSMFLFLENQTWNNYLLIQRIARQIYRAISFHRPR